MTMRMSRTCPSFHPTWPGTSKPCVEMARATVRHCVNMCISLARDLSLFLRTRLLTCSSQRRSKVLDLYQPSLKVECLLGKHPGHRVGNSDDAAR